MTSGLELDFSDVLFALTNRAFSEGEAQKLWSEIRMHNEKLRGQLGRDPGILVAALDYLSNFTEVLVKPSIVEQSKMDGLAEQGEED